MFLLTVITFHKLETETVADFLIQRFYFDIVLSLDVLTDDGVLLASGAPVTTDNPVHVLLPHHCVSDRKADLMRLQMTPDDVSKLPCYDQVRTTADYSPRTSTTSLSIRSHA